MGLFSKPKCPHCNSVIKRTYAAFPYPQWRCDNCIETNTIKRKNNELEARIKALESKLTTNNNTNT